MSSQIDTYLHNILTHDYARDVRTAIVNAIQECYDNTQNPSLREEAFIAAIEAELLNGHLTGLDLGDGDVTTSKIANSAVTTAKIADGAITQAKLDPNIDFVQVDDTLSHTGEAADAAAVGDTIDEVKGSIVDIREEMGLPITRKLVSSDLEVVTGTGSYGADASGNLVCTTSATDDNKIIVKIKNAQSIDWDFPANDGLARFSRIILGSSSTQNTNQHYVIQFSSSGGHKYGLDEVKGGNLGSEQSSPALAPYDWNQRFSNNAVISHFHIDNDGSKYNIKAIGSNAEEFSTSIPLSVITGIPYVGIGVLTHATGTNPPVAGDIFLENVICKFAGSGEQVDINSKLYGKKWLVFGDSISNSTEGDGHYMDYIAQQVGMRNIGTYGSDYSSSNPFPTSDRDVVNLAKSGTTWKYLAGNSQTDLLHAIDNDETYTNVSDFAETCDFITVMYGVNDYLLPGPSTIAQVKEAVERFIDWCIIKNPFARLGVICPIQVGCYPGGTGQPSTVENGLGLNLEDYVNAIKEAASGRGVPVLDMYHEGQFYANNLTWCSSEKTGYFNDIQYLHPNGRGHRLIGGVIRNWMENVLATSW